MSRSTNPTVVLGAFLLVVGGCSKAVSHADAGVDTNCAPGSPAQIAANCVCQATADCATGNHAAWACTPLHKCLQTCETAADCQAPQVCEDGLCRPPACGDDNECAGGQQCLGGSCQAAIPASAVDRCVVVPPNGVINAGGVKTFWVLPLDSSGQPLSYLGPVAWSVAGAAATTSATGLSATVTAAPEAPPASGFVDAAIGSVGCAPATLLEYAAATGFRVVVVSDGATAGSPDGTPLAGATVVVDDGAPVTTDTTGAAAFSPATGSPHTISVYLAGYTYVTIIDMAATDVVVPLKPSPARGVFTGVPQWTDFARVGDLLGTWHMSLSGASFAGNLMDLYPTRMLGPGIGPMAFDLGGTTTEELFEVPEGVEEGLGSGMFGDGYVVVEAEPGYRTLWSLGSNEQLTNLLGVFSGNAPSGTAFLLAQLQTLGLGDSGVVSDVAVTAGERVMFGSGVTAPALDSLLRLHTNVRTPVLPPAIDSELIIGGVLAGAQGFVPLGLTMAIDQTGPGGNGPPDSLTDGVLPGQAEQQIGLRIAPRHGGLECAPWAFVTLAVPSLNVYATDDVLTLSGTVNFSPASLRYDGGADTPVDLSRPFIAPPAGAAIDEPGRTFTLPVVPGSSFNRLDIGPETSRWSIYFPAAVTSVIIPQPPAGISDRFPGVIPGSASAAVVHAARLGYPPPGTTLLETYDGIWLFDGIDANDLTPEIDAFSAVWVPRPEP